MTSSNGRKSFAVLFDLRPNKRLSKQSWGWWFETPSRPLWRHCKVYHMHIRDKIQFWWPLCKTQWQLLSTLTSLHFVPQICLQIDTIHSRLHAAIFIRRADQRSPIARPNVYCFIVWPTFYAVHYHDDVIKWKQIPRYWPFVPGIHRSPVNSPHKGQWRGALMFSLICT